MLPDRQWQHTHALAHWLRHPRWKQIPFDQLGSMLHPGYGHLLPEKKPVQSLSKKLQSHIRTVARIHKVPVKDARE